MRLVKLLSGGRVTRTSTAPALSDEEVRLHTRPFQPVDPAKKAQTRSSDNSNRLYKHAVTLGWTTPGITCRTTPYSGVC